MKTRQVSIVLVTLVLAGCRGGDARKDAAEEPEPWAVTAWGRLYEVFPETAPLVQGKVSPAHTHVTVLSDFSPLREGKVEILLRGRSEQRFAGTLKRDGIFDVPVQPNAAGEFDLVFRIESRHGMEEIPGGRVRVGDEKNPGGLVEGPKPPHGVAAAGGSADTVPFLKEQQWRTPFATAWTSESEVRRTLAGAARVRASAGGELLLTAPVDAILSSEPWPHRGQELGKGATIFRFLPSINPTRSLAQLRADAAALEAEARTAREREERLARLLGEGAASRAEVARARAEREALDARLAAARRDHEMAAAARSGRPAGPLESLVAPFEGAVADVSVTPGQAVTSGASLGRFVKTQPVWIEVALRPEDALQAGSVEALFLRRPGDAQPLEIAHGRARVISRAPEVDRQTGTIAVTLEVQQGVGELPIGSSIQAELIVPGSGQAIVVPATALVDDGGVTVAYVQIEGESFARRPVQVMGRQGVATAIKGLSPGERLVTRGAAEIRRASLLSTGAPEGHVH
jgi:membrane fusion protein, heavy metal efflux system